MVARTLDRVRRGARACAGGLDRVGGDAHGVGWVGAAGFPKKTNRQRVAEPELMCIYYPQERWHGFLDD